MTTTSYFTTDSSTTDLTTTDLTTTDATTTDLISTDSTDLNATDLASSVTASISYLFPCGSNNNSECSDSYAFDAYSTFKVTLLVKIFDYDLVFQNDGSLSSFLDDCAAENQDPSCITWNMKNHNSIETLNEYFGDSVSFSLSNTMGESTDGTYYSFETTLSFSNQRTSNGGYCYDSDSIPDWWFIPGEFYSFSVNFSDVGGSDYTDDVYFNDLAKGGSCMLDNDTYSLLDEFVISCDNWTDSDADDSYLLYNGLLNDNLMRSQWTSDASDTGTGYVSTQTNLTALIQDLDGGITCYEINLDDVEFNTNINDFSALEINETKDAINDLVNSTDFSDDYGTAVTIQDIVEELVEEQELSNEEAAVTIDNIIDNIIGGTVFDVNDSFDDVNEITGQLQTISTLVGDYEIVSVNKTVNTLANNYLPIISDNIEQLINSDLFDTNENEQCLSQLQTLLVYLAATYNFGTSDVDNPALIDILNEYTSSSAYLSLLIDETIESYGWSYSDEYISRYINSVEADDDDDMLCGELEGSFCVELDNGTSLDAISMHSTEVKSGSGRRRNLDIITSDPISPTFTLATFVDTSVDDFNISSSSSSVSTSSSCYDVLLTFEIDSTMAMFNGVELDDWDNNDYDQFPVCGAYSETGDYYDNSTCYVYNHTSSSVVCACKGNNVTGIDNSYQIYQTSLNFDDPEEYIVWSYDPTEDDFPEMSDFYEEWRVLALVGGILLVCIVLAFALPNKIDHPSIGFDDVIYKDILQARMFDDVIGYEMKAINNNGQSSCKLCCSLICLDLCNKHLLCSLCCRKEGTNLNLWDRICLIIVWLLTLSVLTMYYYVGHYLHIYFINNEMLIIIIFSLISLIPVWKVAANLKLVKPKEIQYEELRAKIEEKRIAKQKKKLLQKNKSNSMGSQSGTSPHIGSDPDRVAPMGFGDALNKELAGKLKQKKREDVIKRREQKARNFSNASSNASGLSFGSNQTFYVLLKDIENSKRGCCLPYCCPCLECCTMLPDMSKVEQASDQLLSAPDYDRKAIELARTLQRMLFADSFPLPRFCLCWIYFSMAVYILIMIGILIAVGSQFESEWVISDDFYSVLQTWIENNCGVTGIDLDDTEMLIDYSSSNEIFRLWYYLLSKELDDVKHDYNEDESFNYVSGILSDYTTENNVLRWFVGIAIGVIITTIIIQPLLIILTTWVKVWSYDHRRGLLDDNYHKMLCCVNISCYPCCLGWHKLLKKEGSVGARGRTTSVATGKSAKYRQAAMIHKSPRSMSDVDFGYPTNNGMNLMSERQSITGRGSTASAAMAAAVASTGSSKQLVPTMVNNDSDKDPDVSTTDPSKSGKNGGIVAVLPSGGSGNGNGNGNGNLSAGASPRFGNNNISQEIHRSVTKEKDKSISHKNALCRFSDKLTIHGFFSISEIFVDHEKQILEDTQIDDLEARYSGLNANDITAAFGDTHGGSGSGRSGVNVVTGGGRVEMVGVYDVAPMREKGSQNKLIDQSGDENSQPQQQNEDKYGRVPTDMQDTYDML